MEIENAGFPGENTRDALKRFPDAVAARHPDCVVLLFGTNDLLNSYNLTGQKEFRDNLRSLIVRILELPGMPILCQIPRAYQPYMEKRHKAGFFRERSAEDRVTDANRIIGELAKEFSLPLVPTAELLGTPGEDAASCFRNEKNSRTPDGVHPTREGYARLAGAVAAEIRRLVRKPERIVCFGDSITFGLKMPGEGTADRSAGTYPGQLSNLLATWKGE